MYYKLESDITQQKKRGKRCINYLQSKSNLTANYYNTKKIRIIITLHSVILHLLFFLALRIAIGLRQLLTPTNKFLCGGSGVRYLEYVSYLTHNS